jgi:Rhodopirellula transposase DDE domain
MPSRNWTRCGGRLFSFISRNWRARPLVSLEVIVNLIGATRSRTGLEVYAQLDERAYPDKIPVSNAELAALNIHRATFHPEWNYTIKPRT